MESGRPPTTASPSRHRNRGETAASRWGFLSHPAVHVIETGMSSKPVAALKGNRIDKNLLRWIRGAHLASEPSSIINIS